MSLATPHSAFAQAGDAKKGIDAATRHLARHDRRKCGRRRGLYTDDAMVMPPNGEAVIGRPAIEKLFQAMVATGQGNDADRQGSRAHGDAATEIGAYSVKDAAGKEIDRGKYMSLEASPGAVEAPPRHLEQQPADAACEIVRARWRRRAREYKVLLDLWSGDLAVLGRLRLKSRN